jgi:acyl carrier protein
VPGAPTIPIGRPIANTALYVLDADLEPVPIGVPGELYIGGAGVVRGYLRRPQLTAERFVVDPFSGRPGDRMYRTGDRVRRLPDGVLEFLGRVDSQVKVRGHRLELGEIEVILAEHEAVREAAAAVREDRSGGKYLVAFVVAKTDPPPTAAELKAHLRGRLPAVLVPTHIGVLDVLPLTPNGKLDRNALPAFDGPAPQTAYVAPRNPIEERLSALWAEMLGRERVGADDDFFELGGHSLLATHMAGRIRDTFGVELPLRRFFERPTVTGVADVIARRLEEELIRDGLLSEVEAISDEEAEALLGAARDGQSRPLPPIAPAPRSNEDSA